MDHQIAVASRWNKHARLRNDLAIHRADDPVSTRFGTLGLGLRIDGAVHFTTCAHVVKEPNASGVPIRGWDDGGAGWSKMPLRLATGSSGIVALAARVDLALIVAEEAGENRVDLPYPVSPQVSDAAGSTLWYRGAREAARRECALLGRFNPADPVHSVAFPGLAGLGLELSCFNVVRFDHPISLARHEGNSGTALWGLSSGSVSCFGHLSAVSERGFGLALSFERAFSFIGLTSYDVLPTVAP